ncbi:MAG: 4-(cytidine 5'-diphospho)-2-C-methyl-D-erythritol kinase [Burkholderiales bacterium]|nr:4-(cytidine 5'-diphospho)-2-C-methyl-D-erythritol kinase [Burkholderiales bacterium]
MNKFLNLPAPAKLNLFLHVVGKRQDGYHLLQSVFQLIDLCDYVNLEGDDSGHIIRKGDISWEIDKDLCVKAAKRLQQLAPNKGVSIEVNKNIPTGAGLGGGSSDAATVLIGLNLMWKLGLTRKELMEIGMELGADVPFFIFGQTAFVEGIGEILSPIEVKELFYKVIFPDIHTSTVEVFKSPLLKKSQALSPSLNLQKELLEFAQKPFGKNDLQQAAESINPTITSAVQFLSNCGKPRMTGSGSAVFSASETENTLEDDTKLPPHWKQWVVKGIKKHPLYEWIPE